MTTASRHFDIIILGATGFTGRLVAEYLDQTYGLDGDLKWAMAGRNMEKLEQVRKELGNEDIPLLQADSLDRDSIDALTRQTRVLCTTVGPYALYGSETVASCVENETHYCDLTGEVPWIRRMIDQHHVVARKKKLKIVHCCGYDSIPSELGVFFLQQKAKEKFGEYCRHIKTGVKASKGGLSGGTIASLGNILTEAEKDKSIYALLADPYGLNPEGMRSGPDEPDLMSAEYDSDFERWTGPFMMASINTRVVRRGLAIMGNPYGTSFRYDEFLLTGKGLGGRLKGYANAMVMSLAAAKPGSLMSKLIGRFAPKPGEGPSLSERENGYWVFDILGILPGGQIICARMKGDRDPGYGSTSKMLGETAVCLARDDLNDNHGVITPASAMGGAILERLQQNAGITVELRDK